ncbi:MAG: hypothetical protein IJ953_01515 [Campylobacter sp.]|nr:hypothetical protein [Campylobacter sp.]
MKKFILFITLVASVISANAYSYGSSSYGYQELSDRAYELERENRRKRDAQMRSLGTDDFYRQNLPFDPGF